MIDVNIPAPQHSRSHLGKNNRMAPTVSFESTAILAQSGAI